jgi:hypothetical protein
MNFEDQFSALERLADLRSRGILTEEQYETQKARVLKGAPRVPRLYVIIAVIALIVAATTILGFLLHSSTSVVPDKAIPKPRTPKPISPAATTPIPSPAAAPIAAPETPPGRGKSSVADPIAQSPSQASGMTPEKTLTVAGKKVVLFKSEGEGIFDANYVLMVGRHGEVLDDNQIYSISTTGPYVILQESGGGTACPAVFRIVDVVAEKITDTFGTCSDLIRSHIASDGSLIAVVHKFNVGGPVTSKYFKGVMTTWGEE